MLKLTQQNLLAILEWSLTKTSASAHIYLQSAVHVFATSGIYGAFAVTLIWIVQNLLANGCSCLAVLTTVIQLLSGIAETDLTKLQRVLNRLARVVTKSPPFTRSVPLLRSLHWLPVKHRVHFKICLLTYKGSSRGTARLPLLLDCHFASITLTEIKHRNPLCPSLGSRPTLAQGPSAHVPPFLWNNLPLSVRSATSVATFRRRLKTYLFDLAFPQ